MAVVAFVVLLVALLSAGGSAGKETTAGPDPAVREWPSWPYRVACHDLPFDPIAAFSSPTGVERGSRPSEVALRRFLQEIKSWPDRLVPMRNWRLLAETERRAEFASGRLSAPGGPSVISVEYEDGRWRASTLSSGCKPETIVRGIRAITWTLADPEELRKDTKTIRINLGSGPCASGRSQNARAMKPIFKKIGGGLLMIMRLRPLPPGAYTCLGISEPPLKVRLPKKLGERKLYDGGTYPPTDVVDYFERGSR